MSGLNRASAGCWLRKTVVAHVFGERTMATLGRLMSLLSPFDVVIWMTDGWSLYESRLKGKLHVISKRYTQRIERHKAAPGKAGTEAAVVLKIGGAA